VLRSQPKALASEQRLAPDEIDRIHAVAAKYYRLIVMDSGNDESDPMWLRMIDLADQIVLATSSHGEPAEAAALLLEELGDRDQHSADLARHAVVVVSEANAHAKPRDAHDLAAGFAGLVRETVTIPYDPGHRVRPPHLRPAQPRHPTRLASRRDSDRTRPLST